ncbi:MAG: tail fiber domain-containing protein [Bacteroidales bacterium]|nr:tail fiber domain-containing protein [Candidatus Scybalousia scybalohippi]
MEILEVELGHSTDINVDIIENPDTAILEVYWQDEVELNYDLDVQFIKNGEREIDSYVVNVVKPEIREYAEEVATQYVQQYAATTINNYVESVIKPDIDDYTDAKLTAFNTNATAKTDDFNTLAQESEQVLVQYVNSANASAITATTQAGIATSKASDSLASANASASSAISAQASAEQAEEALKSITGVYRVKGSVATYNDLPSVGQKVGDVYNVLDSGANYVWTDSGWDKLSETVDLSKYALKTDLPTIAKAGVPGLVAGGNWLTVNQTTGKMECGELTKAQYDSALGYTFISKTTLNNVLKDVFTDGVIATGSTEKRTLQDRFADAINVKDFGAKGDGVTDDTTAFRNAGANIIVPSGEYVVNSLNNNIKGDGIIYCSATGQKFRAGGAFIVEDSISKEHKLGEPFFGVNDGVTNTEIYTYASRGIQGAAYVKQGNNEYLFISQTATPSSGSDAGNSCRITQFAINSDGTIRPQYIAFSGILPIGHGQGMGVTIENGEIYLWCQSAYNASLSRQYRGVTKIHWRGSLTTASDVQEIPLIPDTGVYSNYIGLTPTVSTDGKYLIAHVSGARDYMCLIWEIEGLTAYSKPIKQFIVPQNQGINTVQGKCADTNYIYFLVSTGNLYDYQAIFIYDYSGNLIKTKYIGCEKAIKGGIDSIINDTTGLWHIFENEGIYCRGGDICVVGYAVEQPFGDIVELDGINYACIRDANGTSINDKHYFQPTSKTATMTYSPNTAYKSGITKAYNNKQPFYVNDYKYVYSIGRVGDTYAEDTTLIRSRIAQYDSSNNATITAPKGNSFRLNYFNYATGKPELLMSMDYRNMYFYDRYPTGKGYIGGLHWQYDDTNQYCSLNVGTTQKAQLSLYGDNDSSNNYLGISYNNKNKLFFTKDGVAIFNISDYSSANNHGIVFTRNGMTDKRGSIYSTGSTIHYAGQDYLSLEVLDNTNTIKTSVIIGGASPYCRPYITNSTTLGDASHLWKEVFAANAIINTSDERQKQDIDVIDERVFKAWEKVNFVQYKFKSSVEEKGENARIHFGLIAQKVKEAFESEGLDGFKYGLLCYDEWEDEYENEEVTDEQAVYDEDGNEIVPAKTHIEKKLVTKAGNAYGIRYSEALALECAYQRWTLDKLKKLLKSDII